jgi:hypothetical protein
MTPSTPNVTSFDAICFLNQTTYKTMASTRIFFRLFEVAYAWMETQDY